MIEFGLGVAVGCLAGLGIAALLEVWLRTPWPA